MKSSAGMAQTPPFSGNNHLSSVHIFVYSTATNMSSFAKLASAPGLGANYSLYAVPVGWVISYVYLEIDGGFRTNIAVWLPFSGLPLLPTRPHLVPTTTPYVAPIDRGLPLICRTPRSPGLRLTRRTSPSSSLPESREP
jgi:hypothetical protein